MDGRASRVLIASRDPLEIVIRVLGAWSAGAVPAVLHEALPLEACLAAARRIRPAAAWHHRFPLSVSASEAAPPPTPGGGRPERAEALILSTSGSTGEPKLVALPAESVARNAEAIARSLEVSEDDRVLAAVPLSHPYGLIGGAFCALLAGAELHLFPAGTAPPVLQRHLREEAITLHQGPPSFHRLFLAYWSGKAFPSLRRVTVGGEPYSPSLLEGLAAAFPGAEGTEVFGLTEAGPRVAHISFRDARHARGGAGKPFPHLEWRLAPVDGEGDGRRGELHLRGPTVMLGYLDDDGGHGGLDEDGFLRTGDLVEVDEEGCIFPRGRIDGSFKVGGRRVHPLEVERALLRVPGVGEALCRPETHPILGFTPAAVVVAQAGVALEPEGVREACAELLEPYKVPARVEVAASVPRSAGGKIRRG